MGPLDLRRTAPRGPRETLAGLVFMPRTIDKLRAEQPGGDLGEFLNRSDGLSVFMCKRVGIDMEELRAVVADAPDEITVERWLEERLDPVVVAAVNEKMTTMSYRRLTPEGQAIVKEIHPIIERRPDLHCYFDIFEADEAEAARSEGADRAN